MSDIIKSIFWTAIFIVGFFLLSELAQEPDLYSINWTKIWGSNWFVYGLKTLLLLFIFYSGFRSLTRAKAGNISIERLLKAVFESSESKDETNNANELIFGRDNDEVYAWLENIQVEGNKSPESIHEEVEPTDSTILEEQNQKDEEDVDSKSAVTQETELDVTLKQDNSNVRNTILVETIIEELRKLKNSTLESAISKQEIDDRVQGINLLERTCESFQLNHSVAAAENTLIEERENIRSHFGHYYSRLGFAKATLPLIGFAGTIVGIMITMSNMSNLLSQADGSSGNILTSMEPVLTSLAVAFDTTLAALIMAFYVRRKEIPLLQERENLIYRITKRVESSLISRFRVDLIEIINRQVGYIVKQRYLVELQQKINALKDEYEVQRLNDADEIRRLRSEQDELRKRKQEEIDNLEKMVSNSGDSLITTEE